MVINISCVKNKFIKRRRSSIQISWNVENITIVSTFWWQCSFEKSSGSFGNKKKKKNKHSFSTVAKELLEKLNDIISYWMLKLFAKHKNKIAITFSSVNRILSYWLAIIRNLTNFALQWKNIIFFLLRHFIAWIFLFTVKR